MHYGYIGLGNLGANCAACLIKAGFEVTVFDLNPDLAARLVAQGASLAPSAEALAASVDHVITCLPSPAISERVLRAILPLMKPGASWLEMSTLGRDEVLTLGAVANAAGVQMLELPVTGGVHLAAQGKITMLAGGPKELFDLHRAGVVRLDERLELLAEVDPGLVGGDEPVELGADRCLEALDVEVLGLRGLELRREPLEVDARQVDRGWPVPRDTRPGDRAIEHVADPAQDLGDIGLLGRDLGRRGADRRATRSVSTGLVTTC